MASTDDGTLVILFVDEDIFIVSNESDKNVQKTLELVDGFVRRERVVIATP